MQGHERYGARLIIKVVGGSNQGNFVQEVGQAALWVVALKVACHDDKFFEVLDASFVLWVAAGLEHVEVSALFEHAL